MTFDTSKFYAVVMAGGKGERFWPAGRLNMPKQLLSLSGEKTMIEETVLRLFPLFPPEHIFVITNTAYLEPVRKLLTLPPENIIGEPVGRDTAPCAALATATVMKQDPDATMVLLPSDHVIRPARMFQEKLLSAAKQAQNNALITLGIPPTYPATGYGYMHLGESISSEFHKVLEFKEKPDAATAEKFFQDGNYRWNSGIFIWRCDTILEAFRKYAPDLGKKIEGWISGKDYTTDFAECPKISIDYAVMEKADNVMVGDATFYWNDAGSWSSLRSILPLDPNGNITKGNVETLDSSNNVLVTDEGTLLGVIGMHDIAVIKSGNGILVCPLSEEQKVKTLVHQMQDSNKEFL